MKYLLNVFIAHPNQEQFVESLAMEISQLTKANGVKYYYGPQAAVYTFETKTSFENVKSFFDAILGDLSVTHILVPIKTDKMSYWLEKEYEKHLFGTDICKTNQEYSEEEQKQLQDQLFLNSEMDEEENEIEKIIRNNEKKSKNVPTLDDLLDKINQNGISSLTKTEKELLTQYSK
jgi:hypothetical protein